MKLTLLSPALREMLEAVEYYEGQASGLGAQLDADIEATLRLIVEHPAAGSPHAKGTRRLLLERFPYAVIYFDADDRILVVALTHQRRKPDYWVDRV